MSPTFVDLHTHSTASDGTFSPTELIDQAKQNGLSAIALTDHDTVDGIFEAALRANEIGIDFLPGIEISAESPTPGGTLHILGYGIDPSSEVLKDLTKTLRSGRDTRNPRIISRLNQLGVPITLEEVQSIVGKGVMGRPHIAAVLVKKGVVRSIQEAFDRYLGQGGLAYFDKERLTSRQAIERIRSAGGLAVLAHPVQLRTTNHAELERILKDLMDQGLQGIEVLHSDHTESHVRVYQDLARRYGLIRTGGSDFHGRNKPGIFLGRAGEYRISREWYETLVVTISNQKTKC